MVVKWKLYFQEFVSLKYYRNNDFILYISTVFSKIKSNVSPFFAIRALWRQSFNMFGPPPHESDSLSPVPCV